MPLADLKALLRWLEESDEAALIRRRDEAMEAISTGKIKSQDTIRAARRLIKLIEEEIISRLK